MIFQPRVEKWVRAALFAAGLSALGLAAGPAAAQGRARDGSGVSLERFELAGEGCPQPSSAALSTRRQQDRLMLQIRFDGNRRDRAFQVSGPGNQTRSCTALVVLSIASEGPVDVALERAREGIRFDNPDAPGQLVVRSQFRLDEQASTIRAFQLMDTEASGSGLVGAVLDLLGDIQADVLGPQQAADLVLGDLGLRSRSTRTVAVRSVVELQSLGADDATLRLNDLALELRLQPVANAADPDPGSAAPAEPVAAPLPAPPAAMEPAAMEPPAADPPPMGSTGGDPRPPGVDTRGFAPNG